MKYVALLLLLAACDSPAQPMPVDASVPELAWYAEHVLHTEAGDEISVMRTNMNEYFLDVNDCGAQLTPDEYKRLTINMHDLNEVSW